MNIRILILMLLCSASALAQPRLSFFTLQQGNDLLALASDSASVGQLKALNASLKVGISDTSEATVDALQLLDSAQIPMVAWLLLPSGEGTFFHIDNHKLAKPRYEAFKAWTVRNNLRWAGLGLGLINTADGTDFETVSEVTDRISSEARLYDAQLSYQNMIRQAQADGYRVEVYMPPMLFDERKEGTQGYQLLAGIPNLEGDLEMPIILTSLEGEAQAGAIAIYAKEAKSVGIGIVGTSMIRNESQLGLTPEAFFRDLKYAAHGQEVAVATWEGCIGQGVMPKLLAFDWAPASADTAFEEQRAQTRTLLQWLHYPWLVAGMVVALALLLLWTLARIIARIFF